MSPPTYTLRASSLSTLADCPARFKAIYLDGRRLPKSGAAQLGSALHASTGAFDLARLHGDPVSADDTAGVLVDALARPDEDVAWDEDLGRLRAETIGLALHRRYCTEQAPRQTYIAVEVTCEALDIAVPPLDKDGGDESVILRLTGTTDRVRLVQRALGITDFKSGERAVTTEGRAVTKGHGLQTGAYELLAEHATGIAFTAPAQIVGFQTNGKARVGCGEIPHARRALLGEGDRPGLIHFAAKILREGLFYGNPRSMLCSIRFCPAYHACPYRDG